jgi:hypothetical protein
LAHQNREPPLARVTCLSPPEPFPAKMLAMLSLRCQGLVSAFEVLCASILQLEQTRTAYDCSQQVKVLFSPPD